MFDGKTRVLAWSTCNRSLEALILDLSVGGCWEPDSVALGDRSYHKPVHPQPVTKHDAMVQCPLLPRIRVRMSSIPFLQCVKA